MNTLRYNGSLLLAAALLIAVGTIAGCHAAAKTPPEGAPAATAEKGPSAPAAQKAAAGPARSGSQLWAERCGQCHNIRDPGSLSAAQWQVAVAHMRLRIPLTGEEEREIAKFLSAK